MKNKYARVFSIINQINTTGGNVSHKGLVYDFTGGRTENIKELSDAEFREFEDNLINMSPNKKAKLAVAYQCDPLDPTRKAIIAIFKSIGRSVDDAKVWAEKYGVFGVKKPFNEYNGQELYQLIRNAEKMKTDFIKSTNKKLNGLYEGK